MLRPEDLRARLAALADEDPDATVIHSRAEIQARRARLIGEAAPPLPRAAPDEDAATQVMSREALRARLEEEDELSDPASAQPSRRAVPWRPPEKKRED